MTNTTTTILGLDYGEKRVGIARVDTDVKLPKPLCTIAPDETDELRGIIEEQAPSTLVVGLPRGLDGQETNQTKQARQYAASLSAFGLPVVLQDEALTTEAAKTRQAGSQTSLDEIAACIILEDYLKENS